MKQKRFPQTLIVLLSCGLGIVSAVLHWLIPTRILLGSNPPEYAVAAIAAVFGVAAFLLLCFGFVLPAIRSKNGLGGEGTFYMPALFWSVLGLFFGAGATVVKLIQGIAFGFVPVQTEGASLSFSILTLINIPVLCCFAVLFLLEQRKANKEA